MHLWVETEFDSDGDGMLDRMHVDVTRPAQTESEGLKVPVIYETSPYFWGTADHDAVLLGSGARARRHAAEAAAPARDQAPEPAPPELAATSGSFVPRGFAVVHSASPGTGYQPGLPDRRRRQRVAGARRL